MPLRITAALACAFMPIFLAVADAYPASSHTQLPMKLATNIDIPDNEYLIVGQYTGKQKTGEIHNVTTYLTSNIIRTYSFQWVFNNKNLPLPSHYTNYDYIFTIDLSTGQMMRFLYDDTEYFVKKNKNRGMFYEDCWFTNQTMTSVMKFWDGEDVREKRNEFRDVSTNYAFWHYMPYLLIGARIYDWNQPGLVNIWQEFVKDPFLADFRVINRHVMIDTPFGKISTTEVVPNIQDPIFAGILDQFTSAIRLWYEEGPKRRWIKFHLDVGDQTWLLEKCTIWKN